MSSTTSTSTSGVISALILNGVIFAIFVILFLLFRLKFRRIYQPKSAYDLVPEEKKPDPLPPGVYQWIIALLSKPNSFVLQQAGLDGYFFLRYIFIVTCISGSGMLLYPILLPVNATNGKGGTGFDQLSISNVANPKRYYTHALLSWVFYGAILFTIYRELYYYTSFRQAALSTPRYSQKLSSRTVLFQSVPQEYLSGKRFSKLFDGVKRVWIARGVKELNDKVKERTKLAMKLEAAENKLLSNAMKAKLKADKKGDLIEPADEIICYVPQKKRPQHRLKFLVGKKVDTIDHIQEQLPKLNDEIADLQRNFRKTKPMNSVFVEFESQYMAQQAYQSIQHHTPLFLGPAYIGIEPSDIVWSNMRLFWWERLVRRFGSLAAITALVILWAIPVAFVGVISNITYLTNKLPWLRWILNLPKPLLGLVTSLLPTILLAVLMALLPIFIRFMAKVGGAPSTQRVEAFTQSAYFSFLFVNVFLVTTIASSATSTVTQIIETPTSAMSLLAEGLPKSSNFYISYIVLQGFSISGGALFQMVPLILFYVLGAILDSTVRKKWTRFNVLSTYSWGTTFPVYTNLAVIVFAYAIISPLILLFAFAGFGVLYVAYLHNITYVYGEASDARGDYYPRALFQTFVGIYLGEICLLGMFVVGKGWGPIVLEIIMLLVTIFVHMNLTAAFEPSLNALPSDCMRPLDGVSDTPSFIYHGARKNSARVGSSEDVRSGSSPFGNEHKIVSDSEVELDEFYDNHPAAVPLLVDGEEESKNVQVPRNFFMRFLRPDLTYSFRSMRQLVPSTFFVEEEQDDEANKHAYDFPVVSDKIPFLWIPRDPMGLSKHEIEKFRGIIPISDEGAEFNEKGKSAFVGNPPAYSEKEDDY